MNNVHRKKHVRIAVGTLAVISAVVVLLIVSGRLRTPGEDAMAPIERFNAKDALDNIHFVKILSWDGAVEISRNDERFEYIRTLMLLAERVSQSPAKGLGKGHKIAADHSMHAYAREEPNAKAVFSMMHYEGIGYVKLNGVERKISKKLDRELMDVWSELSDVWSAIRRSQKKQ